MTHQKTISTTSCIDLHYSLKQIDIYDPIDMSILYSVIIPSLALLYCQSKYCGKTPWLNNKSGHEFPVNCNVLLTHLIPFVGIQNFQENGARTRNQQARTWITSKAGIECWTQNLVSGNYDQSGSFPDVRSVHLCSNCLLYHSTGSIHTAEEKVSCLRLLISTQ